MIRLYGTEKGNASWARVTNGLMGALKARKQLAGFFDIAQVDDDLDDAMGAGFDAKAALAIGPPTVAPLMVGYGSHQHRLMMIATNSTWLPHTMMERACKMVTAFVGTSEWASGIIRNYAGGKPVYTWPHGVDEAFKPVGESPAETNSYRALHMASTHLERKATRELIFGWATAMRQGDLKGTLDMVVDGPRGYFLKTIHEASKGDTNIAESVRLLDRVGYTPEQMAEFYAGYDLVCQPSRSEGFGLVPLEVRACGIPVLATYCTGHVDHLSAPTKGAVVIPVGENAPVNDGPGAEAPAVSPGDIAEALCTAYKGRGELSRDAFDMSSHVRKFWSWSAVTGRFLAQYGDELV